MPNKYEVTFNATNKGESEDVVLVVEGDTEAMAVMKGTLAMVNNTEEHYERMSLDSSYALLVLAHNIFEGVLTVSVKQL